METKCPKCGCKDVSTFTDMRTPARRYQIVCKRCGKFGAGQTKQEALSLFQKISSNRA